MTPLMLMVLLAGAADADAVINPGFEDAGGWEVVLRSGALGGGESDASRAKSGARSMRLAKGNGLGCVILRTAGPVRVQAGITYTFRGWFHSENAPVSSALFFRIGGKDDNLRYDAIDGSAGWMSQSLLVNSPADRWEKRLITYKSAKDQEIYLHIVLYGNPCSVWLDDMEFTAEPYIQPEKAHEFPTPYSEAQALEVLRQRKPATARVAVEDGKSVLLLNGRPIALPVLCKDGLHDMQADYQAFGKAGIDILIVPVNLGTAKGKPGIWRGRYLYDFDALDRILLGALRKNPRAYLVVDFRIYPYPKWGDEHPHHRWTNSKGEWAYGSAVNIEGFTDDPRKVSAEGEYWWYPSYQSEKWRYDAGDTVSRLVEHIKTTPQWKAVVGFYITGGHDGQFQVLYENDYSMGSIRRFRSWCRDKYGSVDNVARAWRLPVGSFDEISIPDSIPQADQERYSPYLSGGPLADYREFTEEESWELRDYFAGLVKQAAEKDVFTIAYGIPPDYYFKPFLRTKNLDAAGSMSYYPYRNPGCSPAYRPESSFPLYSKLFFQELDLRSWTSAPEFGEVYQVWIGAGDTVERWDAIHRKMAGASLACGYGCWYYDMRGFFDDPRIMQRIGETTGLMRKSARKGGNRFRPDVVVVRADDPGKYRSANNNAVRAAEFYQTMQLETSGVPYDVHYLDDILSRPELQDYKVYIFLQNTWIGRRDRWLIEKKLKCGGRTLVWLYDVGYISEGGKSAAAMSKLVGMRIRTEEKYERLTPQIVGASHPLAQGVAPFQGMSEMLLAISSLDGPNRWVARPQPFWIDDPAVTPLARYAENGRTAMAVREFDGWTSIYLAAPNSLGNDLLNTIARRAGAYVCGKPGQSIHMSGRFISLHGMKSEEYAIALPPGAQRVIDPDTGGVLAENVREFTVHAEAQRTYWFFLD